jgi:hypothetical protein
LDEICKPTNNQVTQIINGLTILSKLVKNIIDDPTNDKFLSFKKTNKAIQNKLLALAPWDSLLFLLEVLGFQDNLVEESYVWLGDTAILYKGYYLIE